jgi:hypothetical protein
MFARQPPQTNATERNQSSSQSQLLKNVELGWMYCQVFLSKPALFSGFFTIFSQGVMTNSLSSTNACNSFRRGSLATASAPSRRSQIRQTLPRIFALVGQTQPMAMPPMPFIKKMTCLGDPPRHCRLAVIGQVGPGLTNFRSPANRPIATQSGRLTLSEARDSPAQPVRSPACGRPR